MKAPKKLSSLVAPPRLSESEWRDLSGFIHESVGIKLSEAKRVFLVSRLLKRLRATGIHSFRDYFRLIQRSKAYGGEHQNLVNAVTTNKTDFFREPDHFLVLKSWLNSKDPRIGEARLHGLRVWCAAASTGEEPYSIAAVLHEELTPTEYERAVLVASDVDTNVLAAARRGVYEKAAVEPVAPAYRMKMFVHGSGTYRGKFRVRRVLREKVQFVQQNLVLPKWRVGRTFDLIFCRNVLIYFDRPTQQQVVSRLLARTERHGLLFLGHAESLTALSIAAKSVEHAVYAPIEGHALPPPRTQANEQLSRPSVVPPMKPKAHSAAPGTSSHSPTIEAESLHVGESRLETSCWLRATLEQSLLLLLYSAQRKLAMVCHIEAKHRRLLRQRLRDVTSSLLNVLPLAGAREESLRAKVVLVDEELVQEVSSELIRLGMKVITTKVVHVATAIWIEPHSERILLQKPCTRRLSSPSSRHPRGSQGP